MRTIDETATQVNQSCGLCSYALHPGSELCSNYFCVNHSPSQQQEPIAMTLGQLQEKYAKVPLFHGRRWGDWYLDVERLCLVHKEEDRWNYEVDIERIRDSATLVDWLYQARGKDWATPTVMYDLMEALDCLFDVQKYLCSWGRNKTINPTEFLTLKIAGRLPGTKDDPFPGTVKVLLPEKPIIQ